MHYYVFIIDHMHVYVCIRCIQNNCRTIFIHVQCLYVYVYINIFVYIHTYCQETKAVTLRPFDPNAQGLIGQRRYGYT